MSSNHYSEQPEFGTDPFSYIIGQPLPKRESHKAMESWSDSHYHPSYGTTTVSLHNWERSHRSVSFGGYQEYGVYKLSTTFVDKGSGVVEDVHDHYILGRPLLEKVKRDFDRNVMVNRRERDGEQQLCLRNRTDGHRPSRTGGISYQGNLNSWQAETGDLAFI